MQRVASIFLTLLIFLVAGNFAAARNQESSASLGDLCAFAVQSSFPDTPGRRTAYKDFNGQTITRTYEAYAQNLLSIIAPTGHPSLTLSHAPARYDFTYDILGRRTGSTVKNKLGSTLSAETYSYDIRSQLTGYTGPNGSIGYGYDLAGNLAGTKSSTPGGYDVSYDYDTLNRLTMVHRGQEGIDPNATELAAYNYDANGNLNGVGYANGVQHAYTYNALNRLTNLGVSRSVGVSPTSLQGYSYTLNKNGHRTQIAELSGRTITNTFDKLHRLTAEGITQSGPGILPGALTHPTGTLSYSYDLVGNRQSRTTTGSGTLTSLLPNQTQSFTPNDRLTSDTYDANGNTTQSESVPAVPAGSSTVTDVYSFDNKLIRRTRADGVTIDVTYNPDGHRLAKLIAQGGLTQRLHHYLTDANNPTGYAQVIEEKDPFDAANPLRTTNLYGHDLVASSVYQPSTLNHQLLYYSYDGLGSVRSLTDESGEIEETYDFDAYGSFIGLAKRNFTSGDLESVDLNSPDSALRTPKSEFLFTGEQFDSDLGMYFLRARYLNTQTGRFHTQDTYEGKNGEPLSLHKYLYVHDNPVMGTDPSGMLFGLSDASATVQALVSLASITIIYYSISSTTRNYRVSRVSVNAKVEEMIINNHTIRMLELIVVYGGTLEFAEDQWGSKFAFENIGSVGVAFKATGHGKYIEERQQLRNSFEEAGNPDGWDGGIAELLARLGTRAMSSALTDPKLDDAQRGTLAEGLLQRQVGYSKWLIKSTF